MSDENVEPVRRRLFAHLTVASRAARGRVGEWCGVGCPAWRKDVRPKLLSLTRAAAVAQAVQNDAMNCDNTVRACPARRALVGDGSGWKRVVVRSVACGGALSDSPRWLAECGPSVPSQGMNGDGDASEAVRCRSALARRPALLARARRECMYEVS